MFARGGYGAMRILEGVDWSALRENPRPVIGYSDLTALHQAIARETGVISFHGPMLNFDIHEGLSPQSDDWLWSMLGGDAPRVHRFEPAQIVSPGRADATLFGGCLSLTAALLGHALRFLDRRGNLVLGRRRRARVQARPHVDHASARW